MKKYIYFLLTILILFSFSSCDGLEGGLFYSIIEESEIQDGNLENDISIGSMIKYVDGSSEYYFIAAGNVYYKTANNNDIPNWVISSPFKDREEDKENSLTTFNMILAGNYLYGIFLENDNDLVLKKTELSSQIIDDATDKAVTVKENDDEKINMISFKFSWDDFSIDALDSKESIIDLYTCEDYVFLLSIVSDGSDIRKYNLYSADFTTFSSSSSLNNIAEDIYSVGELQVDYDSESSKYWVVTGNKVFTTNGTNAGTDETDSIISEADNFKNNGFRSVLCTEVDSTAAGTEIYLTSKEGLLFKRSAGSWSVLKSEYDEDSGIFFKSLFGLKRVTLKKDNIDIDIILIGCEEGYYEIQARNSNTVISASSNENTSLTIYNQFLSIDLSEQVIQDFYFDKDNNAVFSLGFLSGLWRNNFNSEYWNAE